MTLIPTEADELVLPLVRPEAAWDAVAGLTCVAAAVQAAAEVLDAAPASAVCWSGEAAEGYREVRQRMSRRTSDLTGVASAAASAVLDWLQAAAPAVATMRRAREDVRDVHRRIELNERGVHYDAALGVALRSELTASLLRWSTARNAFDQACLEAARRFRALRDGVTDRPLSLGEQVSGAAGTLWRDAVAAPVSDIWGLTGEVLVDRDRWWGNVSGWPGETVDGIASAVMEPRATGAALIDLDAWQAGHYGAAAASIASLLVPTPKWLAAGRELGAVRFAKNIADPHAPMPVLQTVDEMVDGVDLSRHEHAALGHTLRRHVEVDDDYLMDRLTHGTLLDGSAVEPVERGFAPPEASRFTDRSIAEAAITTALRIHEHDLRALAHAPVGAKLNIEMRSPTPLGQVMSPATGGFVLDDGFLLTLRITKGPEGPYIHTAFLGK